jgi:hypothetical protein
MRRCPVTQQTKPTLPIHGVMHRFFYRWTLKDANFTKDKGIIYKTGNNMKPAEKYQNLFPRKIRNC